MMYVRKNKQNKVEEIIPEYNTAFPGVSLAERYPREFMSGLIAVDDDVEVEVGMVYDAATNTFYKPQVIIAPKYETLDKEKEAKITESKVKLAEWLEKHPMTFTDGKSYSVTEEKQALLNSNLASYERAKSAGIDYPLKWNASGEECTEWTYEELVGLSLAIAEYVAPKVSRQQAIEIAIKAAQSSAELKEIVICYDY